MKRFLVLSVSLLLVAALAIPASAQDLGTTFLVSDQVSLNGMVKVASVTLDQPGWLAIYADNGEGAPGNIIGFLLMESGTYPDVWIPIDSTLATPALFAMVHTDDSQIGVFEYGLDGADAPIEVGGAPLMVSFNIAVIRAFDQLITDGQFSMASVTSPQNSWLAIHADENGAPGSVLGYAAVNAGTTSNLIINLSGEATPIVWPVLHADTGAIGEFEADMANGADEEISVGNQGAVLPIWVSPHVRTYDQPLGTMNELWLSQVLLDQPGWVVIHTDENGAPGTVLGYSAALPPGLSTGVTVTIDPSAVVGNTVWAMLHYDTGTAGVYEFGEVDGTDTPVLDAGGGPVMSSFLVLPPEEAAAAPDEVIVAISEVEIGLYEGLIDMPTSLTAGTISFTVTNYGETTHNFEIEGNGIEQTFETDLAPGETRTMELELQPGTYEVYCPVGDHAEEGMRRTLTVTD